MNTAGTRRGSVKPGLFGIFSYFSQIDTDGSGFLELSEIEALAEQIFGKERNDEIQVYVKKVFDDFDDDDSGELSYEEARNFIKGIYAFFEKGGSLSDKEKKKLLGIIDSMDDEMEEEEQEIMAAIVEEVKVEAIIEPIIAETVAEPVQATASEPEEPIQAVQIEPVKAKPIENKPALIPPVPLPPREPEEVIIPEVSEEVKKILANGPRLGKHGELIDENGNPILGQFGELLGADGNSLLGKFGQILGPPDAESLLGLYEELRGPDGKSLLGQFAECLGIDGKSHLKTFSGKFGHIRGQNGKAIVGQSEEILGPDGCAVLGPHGELLDVYGNPILEKFKQIVGPGRVSLLGPHNEILAPGGIPKLGQFKELLGNEGTCLTGPFGQILQPPNADSLLGRYGEMLGPDGKPLLGDMTPPQMLGPDGNSVVPLRDGEGKLIKESKEQPPIAPKKIEHRPVSPSNLPTSDRKKFVEPERKEKKEKVKKEPEARVIGRLDKSDMENASNPNTDTSGDSNMANLKEWDYSNMPRKQTAAELKKEKDKQKMAFLENLRTGRKEGNDGYHDDLDIYLPKCSLTKEMMNDMELPDEFKVPETSLFFRDPVTKKWIDKKQVTKPELFTPAFVPDITLEKPTAKLADRINEKLATRSSVTEQPAVAKEKTTPEQTPTVQTTA